MADVKWTPGTMEMDRKCWAQLNQPGHELTIVRSGADVIACVWADDEDEEQGFARTMAAAPDMEAALRLFVKQWNACGNNSDFGHYFSNVRIAAEAALKIAETGERGQ